MNNNSIWSYWLEETPEALYGAMIPGGTMPFQKYWQGQYGNVYQDYMTQLGKQALGGQPPSMLFGDYLGKYPFSQYWNLLSPRVRGLNTALNPSYTWRF